MRLSYTTRSSAVHMDLLSGSVYPENIDFAGNLCPEILVPWPGMLGSITFCIWLIPHHGAYRLQWCLSDGHITLVDSLSQLIFLWWNPLIAQGVLQVFRPPGNLHIITFFEGFPDFSTWELRSCII